MIAHQTISSKIPKRYRNFCQVLGQGSGQPTVSLNVLNQVVSISFGLSASGNNLPKGTLGPLPAASWLWRGNRSREGHDIITFVSILPNPSFPILPVSCLTNSTTMPRIGLSYNQTLPEAVTHLPHLLGQKPLHLFLLREFKLVFGDEEVVIHAGKGIFHQGVVFLRAK